MSLLYFLGVALIAAFLLLAFVSSGSKKRPHKGNRHHGGGHAVTRMSNDQIAARWATIEGMAASGGGNGLRQAVSEADKLLDQVMRQQGASGDTMGDRLKSYGSRFTSRDSVWRAHKLRNALAHEVTFDLVPSQAKEALSDFERALRDLGAL